MSTPWHIIHPIDPTRPSAEGLRRRGEEFRADHGKFLEELTNPILRGRDGSVDISFKKITERANDFALNLHEFWKSSLDLFVDRYVYAQGDRNWLDAMLGGPVRDVTEKLEPQLKKWEELTSPFADRYDEIALEKTARELLDTLREALKEVLEFDNQGNLLGPKDPQARGIHDPQYKTEFVFGAQIGSALSGLSAQIGGRLIQLGQGKVVPPVTISGKTQETIDRARKNEAGERVANAETSALQIRDDFRTFTRDRLFELREGLIKIDNQIAEQNLSGPELDKMKSSETEIINSLKRFSDILGRFSKEADLPDRELRRKEMIDAQTDFESLSGSISTELDPKKRASDVEIAIVKAAALTDLETPFLAVAKREAELAAKNAQHRLSAYKAALYDAKLNMGRDVSRYWDKIESQFLQRIKRADKNAGEALAGKMEKAFDADLKNQLAGWDAQLKNLHVPPPEADLANMQNLASRILQTADSYSTRAGETILLVESADRSILEELVDWISASLAAICEKIANQLLKLLE